MNSFDAAIYILLILAVVLGFRSGLLRALATIAGYIAAAPVTVAATPLVESLIAARANAQPADKWIALAGVFFVSGMVLGALARAAVTVMFGPTASLPDRLAGAFLGAVRIGLIAVLLVVIFERMIPPHLQPDFLKGSQLRPWLAAAGAAGLKSLPPEVDAFIVRWRRSQGL